MWWSRKLILALSVSCFLTGCGFTPMYAPQENVGMNEAFSQVEIANIRDREGQALRNILIDKLYTQGRPAEARYLLKVGTVKERIARLGIRKDASATRAQLEMSAHMTLLDRQQGKIVLERNLRSVNSFNILRSQYTIEVSEADARQRALEDIGNSIATQLTLFFNREGGDPPVEQQPAPIEGLRLTR